jgi:hypothetical protein
MCGSLWTTCRKCRDWFQESVSKILHNQSFFNILSNLPSNLHYAHLKFCIRLGVRAWLSVCPIILFIHLASNIFSSVVQCAPSWASPIYWPLACHIYGQPLDLMGIHLFCYIHGGEKKTSHNVIWDAFVSITKDVGFHGAREQTHILLLLTI